MRVVLLVVTLQSLEHHYLGTLGIECNSYLSLYARVSPQEDAAESFAMYRDTFRARAADNECLRSLINGNEYKGWAYHCKNSISECIKIKL